MANVDNIEIININISKATTSGKFDIDITWDVDLGSVSYTGSFWLIPYHETGKDALIEIPYNAELKYTRKLTDVTLDEAKCYSFALTAEQTEPYTTCDKVWVTTKTFEGVGIHYEKDNVIVGWNPPHETIRSGIMRLEFSDTDIFYDYGVDNGLHVYMFAIPEAWLDSHCYRMPLPSSWFTQKTCIISMFPYASDISSGPISEKITLVLKPLKIKTVSLDMISNNECKVALEISAVVPPSYVQLGFYEGKRLVHITNPIPFTTNISYTLEGQFAYNVKKYEMAVYISDSEAKTYNRTLTADNRISLAQPNLSADISTKGKITINWRHDALDCTAYSIENSLVYGESYTLLSEDYDASISLTPMYGDKSGVSATLVPFREGFYTNDGILTYRKSAFNNKGFSFSLLDSGITEDVNSSVFSFKKEGEIITVSDDNPPRSDFLEWMNQLFNKGLSTMAYYKIRDVFSRLITTTEEDRLWYMSGIDTEIPRRADVMPGMTLRIESAQYMPQTSSTAENLAGYVSSSVADYIIGLEDGYLTTNSYLSKTLGHFTYIGEPYTNPLFHASAGGLDFYNIDMKQPFWVLSYPDKFPRSENVSNMYTSINATLYAIESFPDTLNPDSDTKYHMVFRARSTVLLFFTVFVNNTPKLIPVGSTINDLLSSIGGATLNLRVFRNTGLGNMVEIFWINTTTYLMQGDRLEV